MSEKIVRIQTLQSNAGRGRWVSLKSISAVAKIVVKHSQTSFRFGITSPSAVNHNKRAESALLSLLLPEAKVRRALHLSTPTTEQLHPNTTMSGNAYSVARRWSNDYHRSEHFDAEDTAANEKTCMNLLKAVGAENPQLLPRDCRKMQSIQTALSQRSKSSSSSSYK